ALVIALRTRKALARLGNRSAAAEFSRSVSKWIEQFGRTPLNFRKTAFLFPTMEWSLRDDDPVHSAAQALRDFGEPGELEHLLALAHQSAWEGRESATMIAVA